MNEQEIHALEQVIHKSYPHEQLSIMSLGGGLKAIRLNNGKIIWDEDDWYQMCGAQPPVHEEEEESV